MKKIFATIASIAMIAACSTAAFAAEEVIGDSQVPGASSGLVSDENNTVNTGVALTVIPVALAAGALTASGIVLKKKSK